MKNILSSTLKLKLSLIYVDEAKKQKIFKKIRIEKLYVQLNTKIT